MQDAYIDNNQMLKLSSPTLYSNEICSTMVEKREAQVTRCQFEIDFKLMHRTKDGTACTKSITSSHQNRTSGKMANNEYNRRQLKQTNRSENEHRNGKIL
jgi:hypothetical protein